MNPQSGNIFAILFAAVALAGVLAAASMQMITGPITTATRATQKNMIETHLLTNARLVVMNASTLPSGGDADADGFIEPIEYVPNGTGGCVIGLTGGGCLPATIGGSLTDPYGSPYGYCVWDHGAVDAGHADGSPSAPYRLRGDTNPAHPVIALISAGANRVFETTCTGFDGVGGDGPVKPVGSDDFLFTFTYAEAVAAAGGLWSLKSGDPNTAEIAKDLQVKDNVGNVTVAVDRMTGIGDFLGITTDLITAKTGGSIFLDGRVGIGTATPERALHVLGNGDISDDLFIESVNSTNSAGGLLAFLKARGTVGSLSPPLNNDYLGQLSARGWNGTEYLRAAELRFRAGSNWTTVPSVYAQLMTIHEGQLKTRLHIAADGKVGIGNESPANMLHILKAAETWDGLRIASEGAPDEAFRILHWGGPGSGTQLIQGGNLPIRLNTGGEERLRVAGNGNVGIGLGLSNPSALFHVYRTQAEMTGHSNSIALINAASMDNLGAGANPVLLRINAPFGGTPTGRLFEASNSLYRLDLLNSVTGFARLARGTFSHPITGPNPHALLSLSYDDSLFDGHTPLIGTGINLNVSSWSGGTSSYRDIYGSNIKVRGAAPGAGGHFHGFYADVDGGDRNWAVYAAKGNVYVADAVGIGVTDPTAKLDVAGAIVSRAANAAAATTINFANANVAYTTANCGAFTLQNMQDGGSYSLAVKGTTSGTCAFTHAGLTFKLPPGHGATDAGKHTVYTFLRAGTDVYVSWIKGF